MATLVSVTYDDGGKTASTDPVELAGPITSLDVPSSALTGVIGVDVECTENDAGDYIVKFALAKQQPELDFHMAVHAGAGAPAPNSFIDGPLSHFALLPPIPGGAKSLKAEMTEQGGHTSLILRVE
ncbi:MAG TPA: hypothetical protein VEX68_00780 [Bryobacteraceae bacterium]|nr:hypothetical protein [Bryobacteraceae bacterium]